MGMYGEGMMQGMPMMGGAGMMVFGLLYVIGIVLFFFLLYRGVIALETMAENSEEWSNE